MDQILNHTELAQTQLFEQFHQSTRVNALVASNVNRLQELEAICFTYLTGTYLLNAVGESLDRIGLLVGESRVENATDITYRQKIIERITINRCQGNVEEVDEDGNLIGGILYVSKALQEFTSTTDLIIEGNGFCYIFTDGSVPITLEMARIIQRACPAGVKVTIAATTPDPFLWEEYGEPTFVGAGFSEYLIDDHIGGILSEIYTFIDI
jgi:hypothetical protein